VFLFLSKVLISSEEEMDPADYEMVGVLGRVFEFQSEAAAPARFLLAGGITPGLWGAQRR